MTSVLAEPREDARDGGELPRFLGTWLPSFLPSIALGLVTFGLNWWLASTPDGGARLGVVVGAANMVAVIVVAVLSGTLDRAHRARSAVVILVCGLGCMAAVGVVLGSSPSTTTLTVAVCCYVAVEVLRSTYAAVTETANIDLAPRHWPAHRIATLVQSQPQVERILVPAAGGALIGAGAMVGLPVAGAVLLVVVLVAVPLSFRHATAVHRASARRARTSTWQDLRISLAFIRRDPDLLFVLVLGVLVNLVAYPFYSLLPAYISRYGLPAADSAALYGQAGVAYGVGLAVGTVLMVRAGRGTGDRLGRAACSLAAICVVLLVATAVPVPAALVASMVVVGTLVTTMSAVTGAAWLRRTSAELRIRVFSVRRLIIFIRHPAGHEPDGFRRHRPRVRALPAHPPVLRARAAGSRLGGAHLADRPRTACRRGFVHSGLTVASNSELSWKLILSYWSE